jgi:hypothetical protein
MPGPRKDYSASEATAHAWIREHLADLAVDDSKLPPPARTQDSFFTADLAKHAFYANGIGRTVEQPLFKLPHPHLLPSSPQDPFTIFYNEPRVALPLPHPTFEHVDEAPEDDDPALALADFAYQFETWSPTTAQKDPEPQPKREAQMTMYEKLERGDPRAAVADGLRNGIFDPSNEASMRLLMQVLAGGAGHGEKKIEGSGGGGGAVLGEVKEEEVEELDGRLTELRAEQGQGEGEGGEVQVVEKAEVEVVQSGRLKGKARKMAKSAGKK